MRSSSPAESTDVDYHQVLFLSWKQQTTAMIVERLKVNNQFSPDIIPALGEARSTIENFLRPENKSKQFGGLRGPGHETVTYAFKCDSRVKPYFDRLLELYKRMEQDPAMPRKSGKVYEPVELVVFNSTVCDERADLLQITVGANDLTQLQLGRFQDPDDIIMLTHTNLNFWMMTVLMSKMSEHSYHCLTQSKTTDEALENIAKTIWYFMQYLPYLRGTATCAEILMDAHLEILRNGPVFNGQVPVYNNKVPMDWLALLSPTPEKFAAEFKKSFQMTRSLSQATLFRQAEKAREMAEAKAEEAKAEEAKAATRKTSNCVIL